MEFYEREDIVLRENGDCWLRKGDGEWLKVFLDEKTRKNVVNLEGLSFHPI